MQEIGSNGYFRYPTRNKRQKKREKSPQFALPLTVGGNLNDIIPFDSRPG
jgi:hypothetical protein